MLSCCPEHNTQVIFKCCRREDSVRVASLLSLILLPAALVAHADQVTITNGDRLSGLIIKAMI